MAVDLPLCQALVQTNFPGRAPVMTRLINLKRESKLTLEQKGNQGRVKTLLWLQERNRGLKKKKRKTIHLPLGSTSCRFLHAPSCVWGPGEPLQGGRCAGLTARLWEVLWGGREEALALAPTVTQQHAS